ncbi:MAG: hypothetical protein HZA24_09825 [Nitrospirae bacterium]|nr:hypothetical protein [Nitrospirota bacterium]
MAVTPIEPHNPLAPRPGAFSALERALATGTPWVWGPPGSGKTALVEGFLWARRIHAVRLATSPAHAEPGVALAHLHTVARSLPGGAGLPFPTGPEWFTRLFHHLPRPLLLVFDDYHRAPAALHPLVAAAVAAAPPGCKVVVLSRAEPPAALARRLPPGALARVGWRALRLSRADARAIAHRYLCTSPQTIAALHAASGGLPAAFTRLLAAGVSPDSAHHAAMPISATAATAATPPLVPPVPGGNGPLRLTVRALGHFEICTPAGPLRHHRKPPRRPLDLFKHLAAAGPDGVPEIHIMDHFWPNADGDAACRALATTLHRLRTLLGYPECVTRAHGWLRLDPQRVWVDAWALAEALDKAGPPPAGGPLPEALAATLASALALYRAPLLSADGDAPWLLPARTHLHARVMHWVEALGGHFEARRNWPRAEAVYRQGLALEPGAPRLERGLARVLAASWHPSDTGMLKPVAGGEARQAVPQEKAQS